MPPFLQIAELEESIKASEKETKDISPHQTGVPIRVNGCC
jgi:hypothetical protein